MEQTSLLNLLANDPALTGIKERIVFALLAYYVTYTLFSFWSYRMAMRIVGVREATYKQAMVARVIDIGLTVGLIAFGVPIPLALGISIAAQMVAFKFLFKSPFGKAILGVLMSLVMAGMFTAVYIGLIVLYVWLFKSVPFLHVAAIVETYVAGVRERFWLLFAVYFVASNLFQAWAHRFAIRATGVREATYGQSGAVLLADLVAMYALNAVNIGFPWILLAWAVIRIAAFKLFFRTTVGNAALGAFVSTSMWFFFTWLYFTGFYLVWLWLFRRPPF